MYSKQRLDGNLPANLFKSSFFGNDFIHKRSVGYHEEEEEEETATGYNTYGYGKIHTWNIVAWAHPKLGYSRDEQSNGCDHRIQKIEILLVWTYHMVHERLVQLLVDKLLWGRQVMTTRKTSTMNERRIERRIWRKRKDQDWNKRPLWTIMW